MKIALRFLISSVLVVGLFLMGLGCNDKPPPPPPPNPPPAPVPPSVPEPPPDPLKGFLTAEQSRVWLRNNYFEVHRTEDGRGYTITANYYDPGPPSRRYGGKTTIKGQGTGSITGPQSALVTIDPEGQLRIRPDNH